MSSVPPTVNEVVKTLAKLGRDLDFQQGEIGRLDGEHMEAKRVYERAYATAFVAAKGAENFRKQVAVLATEDERLAADLAYQKLKAAKEYIRVLRDRLDIGRSLNSAIKSEWVASGQSG